MKFNVKQNESNNNNNNNNNVEFSYLYKFVNVCFTSFSTFPAQKWNQFVTESE
jgi:hypothetical protein